MQNVNERPVCHRAEDLVTYLYGEATVEEARDFAGHMQQCDACRAEFTVFNSVHDSIVAWRNEALGQMVSPATATETAFVPSQVVQHERKLSALAALREFFTVSPLWMRGATAFAGLLMCALIVFAVSRLWQKPSAVINVGNDAKYTEEQFKEAVEREVAVQLAGSNQTQRERTSAPQAVKEPTGARQRRTQLAANGVRTQTQRRNRLTREERVQLAADLGLIPGREEDVPFVLPDEPNQ